MSTAPTILETTLRDGSYTIDFSFTVQDTAVLCRELEAAGLTYIEVGHGVGLGASEGGYGRAAQTDEEYMEAARNALTRASYGMFCIPGIARLEHIDMAQRHGMGFIRVGTNVTEVASSEPFIRKAKACGLFVTANYMKSYAMPPADFANTVKLSEAYGVDLVYLVDSAGGMFPEDVETYYRAVRAVTDIPMGFHAHNNLGMAIANTLKAVDLGFAFVDTTLQGIGRSAGNACTEILVAALRKKHYDLPLDFHRLLDIGHKYVQPLLAHKGAMPLDVVSGYADFHSSYMGHIKKYSAKYGVSPAALIIEVCKVDKINVDEAILDTIAKAMGTDEDYSLAKYGFHTYVGGEQEQPS